MRTKTAIRELCRRYVWQPPLAFAGLCLALMLGITTVWLTSVRVTPALWFQTPSAWSAAVVSTRRYIVLSFGHADVLTARMEWKPGAFAHEFSPNGYGVELADQVLGGGSVLSHVGLVPVLVEVPVARTGPGFNPFATDTYTARAVYVPQWLLIVVLGCAPARWILLRLEYRRAKVRRNAGRCIRCGYDVGASPARCPECGATASPAAG